MKQLYIAEYDDVQRLRAVVLSMQELVYKLEERVKALEARPTVGTTVICPCPCHSGHNFPVNPPWVISYGSNTCGTGGTK